MKWIAIVLVSALMGGMVFGLGLIGYFVYGQDTGWYLPLNIAAGVLAFIYALYENVGGERKWQRAALGLPRHSSGGRYLTDEERASIADPWERYRLSKQRADQDAQRDQQRT